MPTTLSLPIGSKLLDAPVFDDSNNNLAFLDTATSIVYQWNSSLTDNKGAPVNNLYKIKYNFAQTLKTLNQALPERHNTTTTIFQDYPQLTDPNHQFSFQIGSTATTISATFLDEGAGYKNVAGYFFYVYDLQGQPQILTTDPAYQSQGYHYHPTIIFPNASRKNGGRLRRNGGLVPGDTRTLRGNLPSGKFQDVYVGFFIIPNGFKNQTDGIVYNNKPVLYTEPKLNPNYQDQNGIQSIIFEHGSKYYVTFEDIQRPLGDQDFNDLIMMINLDPFPGSNPNFIQIQSASSISSILIKTPTALLVNIDLTTYKAMVNDNVSQFTLNRTIYFNTVEDKHEFQLIYPILTLEVPYKIVDTQGAELVINYTINISDLQPVYNTQTNELENYHIPILLPEHNDDDETIVRLTTSQTIWDIFVSVEHIENAVASEDHSISVTSVTYLSLTNTQIEIAYRNIMVFGDPHIFTYNGNSLTLPHDEGVYRYYQGHDITIDLETWKIPDLQNHPSIVLRDATYIKKVFIHFVGAKVTIDLSTPQLSLENNVIYQPDINTCLQHVNVSLHKNPKHLVHIDPYSQMIVVFIKDVQLTLWCAIHPTNHEYRTSITLPSQNLLPLNLHKAQGLLVGQILKVS